MPASPPVTPPPASDALGAFSAPSPTNPLLGDALALLSALAYAAYVLLLKVRIRNEARISMTLFFGFVGVFNILLIWPVGLFLDRIGVEEFELPHGKMLWASLLINAGITFVRLARSPFRAPRLTSFLPQVSDALYLRAMLLTSPLAVTLGLSLTIPLALAGDILYRRSSEPVSLASLLGGLLVLGSFVANGVLDLKEAERQSEVLVEELEGAEDSGMGVEPERERLLGVEEEERLPGPSRRLD